MVFGIIPGRGLRYLNPGSRNRTARTTADYGNPMPIQDKRLSTGFTNFTVGGTA